MWVREKSRLIGRKSDYRFYEFDYPRNLARSSRTKSKWKVFQLPNSRRFGRCRQPH